MTSPSDRAGFVHVLRALGDGVADVIVVGGWAHRLHAHHPLATATGNPLHTLDADLFVPVPDRSSIRVASLVAAGFDVKLGGLELARSRELIVAAARMRDLDGRDAPIDRVGAVIEAGVAQLFDG